MCVCEFIWGDRWVSRAVTISDGCAARFIWVVRWVYGAVHMGSQVGV